GDRFRQTPGTLCKIIMNFAMIKPFLFFPGLFRFTYQFQIDLMARLAVLAGDPLGFEAVLVVEREPRPDNLMVISGFQVCAAHELESDLLGVLAWLRPQMRLIAQRLVVRED